MITDQQFIDALHQVTEENPNRVAPGAYRMAGEAFCVIGAALARIDESLCPQTNYAGLAHTVLNDYGLSEQVCTAGQVAQHLNDIGIPWAGVREGFNMVLKDLAAGKSIHQVNRDRKSYVTPIVEKWASDKGCFCGVPGCVFMMTSQNTIPEASFAGITTSTPTNLVFNPSTSSSAKNYALTA